MFVGDIMDRRTFLSSAIALFLPSVGNAGMSSPLSAELPNPKFLRVWDFSFISPENCQTKLDELVNSYYENKTILKDSGDYLNLHVYEDGTIHAEIHSLIYSVTEKPINIKIVYRNFLYLNRPFSDYNIFLVEIMDDCGDILQIEADEEINLLSNQYYDNKNNLKVIDEIDIIIQKETSMGTIVNQKFYYE